MILNVWTFGSPMVIFLAGLRQIPTMYYEAAAVDGASRRQQLFRITIPLLTPIIFFNAVLQLIGTFQSFTQAYIVSGGTGGPVDSTLFYTLYLYQQGFTNYNMGYASAMAWLLLVIIGILTVLMFWTSRFGFSTMTKIDDAAMTAPLATETDRHRTRATRARRRSPFRKPLHEHRASRAAHRARARGCCTRSSGWSSARCGPNDEIFRDPSIIPDSFEVSNYVDGWNALAYPFNVYMWNSALDRHRVHHRQPGLVLDGGLRVRAAAVHRQALLVRA